MNHATATPATATPASTPAGRPTPAAPSSLRAWILAARPATLTAAVVPVAVGCACALVAGRLRAGPALAALAGAILIQIGTNFANDVFDHEKGADTHERLGPTRAVQAGLLTAAQMRAGLAAAFGAATLVGVYLTAVAGPAIVVVGLLSLASGLAYTGGPWPLGYHGLGDAFVFVFFGFVAVCGTAFVACGSVPALALAASIPVGAISTAVLVVNNLRDRETDEKAGKRTLAVRLGRRGAIAEYVGLLAVAGVVPVVLWAAGAASAWVLAPLLTVPFGVRLARAVSVERGRALNARLAGTAKLLLAYGLLFAGGLAASVLR